MHTNDLCGSYAYLYVPLISLNLLLIFNCSHNVLPNVGLIYNETVIVINETTIVIVNQTTVNPKKWDTLEIGLLGGVGLLAVIFFISTIALAVRIREYSRYNRIK